MEIICHTVSYPPDLPSLKKVGLKCFLWDVFKELRDLKINRDHLKPGLSKHIPSQTVKCDLVKA